MHPDKKTTAWGFFGGVLTFAGDYFASGQTITLRGILSALAIGVLGKLSAGQTK